MSEAGNSYSLINTDAIGKVGCLLIEKISQAVGWVATHDTPNRIAAKQYIEDIQNSNLDPLLKAAKISRAKRDIKEYCNQSKIISDAIPQISSTSDPSKLDDDWLFMFMDKARLVNSESLQAIWSRILAQECNKSGSIPKRLLNILSFISPEQAKAFHILCQFSVCFPLENGKESIVPIITSIKSDESDIYSQAGLTFFDIQELDSLGLLQYSLTHHTIRFAHLSSNPIIFIGNKRYGFSNPYNNPKLNIGCVLLTTDGAALCSIIDRMPPEGFADECLHYWRFQNNISIVRMRQCTLNNLAQV